MSALFFTVIVAIVIFFLLKYIPPVMEMWRVYVLSKKIPGPPGVPLFGNVFQFPSIDSGKLPMRMMHFFIPEQGAYFTNLCHEFSRKGDNMVGLWFAHQFTVYPISGECIKVDFSNKP